ncbi:NmrA family NAD(P)-binding protein [Burkholderia metallica]|uniref:NmrA family NAD(P)-binding protein n=1 Tax=Burkholderia metallica TaxID=488729 RepID=UPI00157AE465|nr:NmrA family NAD(P)-binding protein [Burkholderia metallica]
MGKTLIFGATGNLSGATADILHRLAPSSLRVATSRASGLETLRERFPDAEHVVADWNDEASLVAAMNGASKLLVIPPDLVIDEHIATPNIINAARASGSIELLVRLLAIPPGLTVEQVPQEYIDTRCGAGLHVVAKPLLDASGLPICYVNVPAWIMFNLALFVATEVPSTRRIALPAITDAARMWVSERDIAEVLAKILSEPATDHAGKEYQLTSAERHTYADVAQLFSSILGKEVSYVDDDKPLRAAMGDAFDILMTYLRHEAGSYSGVRHQETIAELLGRPQESLADYIRTNQRQFQ